MASSLSSSVCKSKVLKPERLIGALCRNDAIMQSHHLHLNTCGNFICNDNMSMVTLYRTNHGKLPDEGCPLALHIAMPLFIFHPLSFLFLLLFNSLVLPVPFPCFLPVGPFPVFHLFCLCHCPRLIAPRCPPATLTVHGHNELSPPKSVCGNAKQDSSRRSFCKLRVGRHSGLCF